MSDRKLTGTQGTSWEWQGRELTLYQHAATDLLCGTVVLLLRASVSPHERRELLVSITRDHVYKALHIVLGGSECPSRDAR